jgi:hypothetical protein
MMTFARSLAAANQGREANDEATQYKIIDDELHDEKGGGSKGERASEHDHGNKPNEMHNIP